jgi:hypothetical protein
MPIWKLTPTNLRDTAWQASTYKGEVLVRAADERKARQLAAATLRTMVLVRLVQHTAWTTPWGQPHLVRCSREYQSIYPEAGPAEVLWPETGT